ncbi:4-amino-4-deoxychorismate lyase [Halobacteriales archaeon QS_8_69_73]|nr:MAG: 4-amino-4-deoxychorismate lyase [Halobacteriales archaeon QS_8_69_73]
MQYHLNGELVPREEATVSVDDRGFRYGDAVFETCRAYGGEVYAWDRHVDRLREGCETLGMAEAAPDDIAVRVAETLDANDLADAYVRISVSRGVQPGKLTPQPDVDPTVVVYVKPLPRGGVDGEPVTDSYRPDEALMRDVDGNVAEGATSNLFFVDDGVLKTPAAGSLLPGITRELVVEFAEAEGFPVETGRYSLDDVREADEAFLTNSTWELRPVERVDGIAVGDGPMTSLLRRLYDERVEERCY